MADNRLMVICQKCRKLWMENSQGIVMGYTSGTNLAMPSHLFPREGQIGGFAGFQ